MEMGESISGTQKSKEAEKPRTIKRDGSGLLRQKIKNQSKNI